MAGQNPNWEGLLKWSLSHSDGTRPTQQMSEEDRKWFMEAMQAQTIDVVQRMKEITAVMQTPQQTLNSQGVTVEDLEGLLDELQEHVESIDMANDLHSIGGLKPLLGYLKNPHAELRAKAAEVVSTIVQNNPKSQKLVMDEHGLELLLEVFKTDSDITARTKALGAISGLIRHNKPGIAAFRLGNGLAELRDAANTDNVKFQRKAMFLMQYLLHEDKADCDAATKLGLHRLFIQLAASDDADVREAALESLLELTRDGKTQAAGLSEEDGKLKHVLQDRIKKIGQMSKDELGAAREERHLIDSLWKTCYNEPSSLESDGLLYLPGDDDLPPDVASKFFEPPLRAWAAPRPDNTSNTASEKQEQPVLLLGAGSTSSADHRNEAAELLPAEEHNSGSS